MLLKVRHGRPFTRVRDAVPTLRSAQASEVDRWLGPVADQLRQAAPHWPVAIAMAKGGGPLWAYRGDILGQTNVGRFASYGDYCWDFAQKRFRHAARVGGSRLNTFASFSDLIAEAAAGKQQTIHFTKAGTTAVVGVLQSMARVGPTPAGVATAAAAPAGESPTRTSPAGLALGPQQNAAGGDTLHIVSGQITASIASQLLLIYDRFFQVNHDISVDPRTVTGVPTRYQATTSRGSFISCEVSTALGVGTPTYEVTYMDQDGNAAEAATSLLTIAASAIVNRFPFATPDWMFRFNTGDNGARKITNLNLSAASTGNLNVFQGLPLLFIPAGPVANLPNPFDCVNQVFSIPQVVDDACLALAAVVPSVVTACNYTGSIVLVSG